jgi:isoleucyl-tRNA synthetase
MPIEYALSKQGINKNHNLTIAQKRDNCKAFAAQQISIQKQQFARLGLLTDFSKTYVTYDPAYEQQQLMVFVKAIKQKLIYQDLKPVY